VAIMGMLMMITYPSIMNSLETRDLENSARDIQTTLQQARFRAVDTRINHRVRFALTGGLWRVSLERETATGTWEHVPGFLEKIISPKYVVSVNLPVAAQKAIEFSSVGIVQGYDSTQNSLSLQSLKLKAKHQPDLRILTVFGGGSIRYDRATGS
jgi:Tfp pilus assembly protein FimT